MTVSKSTATGRAPPAQPRTVIVYVPEPGAYGRQVVQGVARSTHGRRDWMVILDPEFRLSRIGRSRPRPDGMIALPAQASHVQMMRRMPCPVVSASTKLLWEGAAVLPDNLSAGRLAAEHLLERSLTHFGYCGYQGLLHSRERREGFVRALAEAGHGASIYARGERRFGRFAHAADDRAVAAWVRSLPRPAGVLACDDSRARHVAEAAMRQGLSVPEDLAVVGVDNDELLCDLSYPPLSSVDLGAQRIGAAAVALLERLMRGEPAPGEPVRIAPIGVGARQSSDVVAVEEPYLAKAVRYIREHACRIQSVDQVLDHVPVSRRWLEMKFQQMLGRSPHAEVRRVRLQRARSLLVQTDLTIEAVAQRCGFATGPHFIRIFQQQMGQTPGAYRRWMAACEAREPGQDT